MSHRFITISRALSCLGLTKSRWPKGKRRRRRCPELEGIVPEQSTVAAAGGLPPQEPRPLAARGARRIQGLRTHRALGRNGRWRESPAEIPPDLCVERVEGEARGHHARAAC